MAKNARLKIYEDALAAVKKAPKQVTRRDRIAVMEFLDEISSGSGSRAEHFEKMVVGYRAIVGNDKVAQQVWSHLREITQALSNFSRGKIIPKKLGPLASTYVSYWLELAKSEHELYQAAMGFASDPEVRKIARRAARD
jgi:hypothetical protein